MLDVFPWFYGQVCREIVALSRPGPHSGVLQLPARLETA
jgi:hypothetical protein